MNRKQILPAVLSSVMMVSGAVPVLAADTSAYMNATSTEMKNVLESARSAYSDAADTAAQADASARIAQNTVNTTLQAAKDAIAKTQADARTSRKNAQKALTEANKALEKAKTDAETAAAAQKKASDAYYEAKSAYEKTYDALNSLGDDAKASEKEAAEEASDKAYEAFKEAEAALSKADQALATARNAQTAAESTQKKAQTAADQADALKTAADELTVKKVSDEKSFQEVPNAAILNYLNAVDAMNEAQAAKTAADKDAAQKEAVLDAVEKALEDNPTADQTDIKDAKISAIDAVTYTGQAIEPVFTVTLNGVTLEAGRDYSIVYSENVNAGTAKISLLGIGDYTGALEITFTINPQDLKSIKSILNVTAKSADVVVEGADGKTVDPSNYAVSISKADDKNVYVVVVGKQNYRGTLNGTAEITGTGTTVTSVKTESEVLYRVYNPNSGEHFYTKSVVERSSLIKAGWKAEGTAWNTPKTGKAVYRLYNPNTGDHHYTVSAGEKDALAGLGWNYEGIGWYAADASDTNAVAVYRQYNPNAKAGAHNFTTNKTENDYLAKIGWKAEGIAWYAVNPIASRQ